MTTIMLLGGPRDGDLLEVPGDIMQPTTMHVNFQIPVKSMYDVGESVEDPIRVKVLKVDILPRDDDTGPLWYVNYPKELW